MAILRSWVVRPMTSKPFISISAGRTVKLSFFNLVEAHLLEGTRRHVFERYMDRIVWAKDGEPARLFPFTRKGRTNDPKTIVIDPTISFGRPVLTGTGIATDLIASRFKAGESITDLAKDYERKDLDIEEAILWEFFAA